MILVSNNHPTLRFPKRETFRTVESVLHYESVRAVHLSVVFVGSRFIRTINRRFLYHDYITDVIAFPLEELRGIAREGELYVNLDRARSQAREYGVSFAEETRRLLIHGTLHLLGYSDTGTRAKAEMTRRENWILACLTKTNR